MIRRPNTPSADALCCCEYYNTQGERSHILTCCCDCEALDSAFDKQDNFCFILASYGDFRCLRCQPVTDEHCDVLMGTVSDRCRIPWCSGKGAINIKLEVLGPIVTVPCSLLLATLNSFFTAIVLILTPILVLFSHRVWSRRVNKRRTQLFYMWGLTATICMYYIFEFVVVPFREILLWENLLLTTMFGGMIYALYHAKKDPGIIRGDDPKRSQNGDIKSDKNGSINSSPGPENRQLLNPIGSFLVNNLGFNEEEIQNRKEQISEEMANELKHSIPEEQVNWVDSRPIRHGRLTPWCSRCRIFRPVRCGHCPVCDVCIRQRDHHCVWIDTCVGQNNQRAFFIALVLFVIGGVYGCHLTLTTVCTPEMYFDWFLFPRDCRFVYSDLPTSLAFVSACYSLMTLVVMALTCLNQIVLISQNVTSQELHNAGRRGWLSCLFFAKNNRYNRGLLRNWFDFLSGARRRTYHSLSV